MDRVSESPFLPLSLAVIASFLTFAIFLAAFLSSLRHFFLLVSLDIALSPFKAAIKMEIRGR